MPSNFIQQAKKKKTTHVWVRSWLSRSERRAKLRSQPGKRHACGFSPVCTRVCTSMSALRRNARPQKAHWNLASPLWMFRWRLRLPLSWNSRPHPGKEHRKTCLPAAVFTGASAIASAVGDICAPAEAARSFFSILTGLASTSEENGEDAVVAGDTGTADARLALASAAATVGDCASSASTSPEASKPVSAAMGGPRPGCILRWFNYKEMPIRYGERVLNTCDTNAKRIGGSGDFRDPFRCQFVHSVRRRTKRHEKVYTGMKTGMESDI